MKYHIKTNKLLLVIVYYFLEPCFMFLASYFRTLVSYFIALFSHSRSAITQLAFIMLRMIKNSERLHSLQNVSLQYDNSSFSCQFLICPSIHKSFKLSAFDWGCDQSLRQYSIQPSSPQK